MRTFTEELDYLRVKWKRGSRPDEIVMCCPFCVERGESEDTRFRLGVNVSKNLASCFNCNWRSRKAMFWILKQLGSAVQTVDQGAPIEPEEQEETVVEKPDDWFPVWKVERGDYPAYDATKYLLRRNISLEEMKKYDIGISLTGPLQYRFIFPVYWKGELHGLVARDWTGKSNAKYKNSIGEKYIWNLPRKIPQDDVLVLSEGCFKAIAIEKALGAWSGAVLGHSVTDTQLQQLKEARAYHLVVWPDPDRAGLKGCLDMCEKLECAGFDVSVIWPAPTKQADELVERKIQNHYRKAEPFTWRTKSLISAYISFS